MAFRHDIFAQKAASVLAVRPDYCNALRRHAKCRSYYKRADSGIPTGHAPSQLRLTTAAKRDLYQAVKRRWRNINTAAGAGLVRG